MHLIVEMEKDILAENSKLAQRNAEHFREHNVRAFDVMGAIGSGKTTLIETIAQNLLEKGITVGAIAGDVSGDDDYKRFTSLGIPAANINTGKECHLDAHYLYHALEKFPLGAVDVLFIENVGNLVCPADFPLGTEKRIVVISVTEGDDMVRKHPVIFGQADIVVVNKVDLAEYMDVDVNVIIRDYKKIKPSGIIVLTDAKHGRGIEEVMSHLNL